MYVSVCIYINIKVHVGNVKTVNTNCVASKKIQVYWLAAGITPRALYLLLSTLLYICCCVPLVLC